MSHIDFSLAFYFLLIANICLLCAVTVVLCKLILRSPIATGFCLDGRRNAKLSTAISVLWLGCFYYSIADSKIVLRKRQSKWCIDKLSQILNFPFVSLNTNLGFSYFKGSFTNRLLSCVSPHWMKNKNKQVYLSLNNLQFISFLPRK